jgi:hypothetical protein
MNTIKYQLVILATLAFTMLNARADFSVDFPIVLPVTITGYAGTPGSLSYGFNFSAGAIYSFDSAAAVPLENMPVLTRLINLGTGKIYSAPASGLPPGAYALQFYWTELGPDPLNPIPVGLDTTPASVTFDSSVSPVGITRFLIPTPEPSQNLAGAMILGGGGLVLLGRRALKK